MSEDLSELTLIELFDLLVQPDAPAPVSMMPQTQGWVWLGLGLVLVIGLTVWRYVVRHRANAYRRAALRALEDAGDDPTAIADTLRRTALAGYPRELVAGLSGDGWLAFLDEVADDVTFSGTEAGRTLAMAPYRPVPPARDLPDLARRWVRSHKPWEAAQG